MMRLEVEEASCSSVWTKEEDKAFEDALATHPEEISDRWDKILADVPGKSLEEIKRHYELLVDDVSRIESGYVPLPFYNSFSDDSIGIPANGQHNGDSNQGNRASRSDQERRKGVAWTEDEHRLFLLGLEKYGKGDWRSISRNFVVTRTPTQVASHAQKYFIRLNSMNKDRRRSSIHDITNVNNGDVAASQVPITGQSNGSSGGGTVSIKSPPKQTSQNYGTPTLGQPIGGPLVSAVGTPVSLPAPPHFAYGVRAPVSGTVVTGAPMAAMIYPMPPAAAHR